MRGAGIDQIRQGQLVDIAQSLERAGIDELTLRRVQADKDVNGIPDLLEFARHLNRSWAAEPEPLWPTRRFSSAQSQAGVFDTARGPLPSTPAYVDGILSQTQCQAPTGFFPHLPLGRGLRWGVVATFRRRRRGNWPPRCADSWAEESGSRVTFRQPDPVAARVPDEAAARFDHSLFEACQRPVAEAERPSEPPLPIPQLVRHQTQRPSHPIGAVTMVGSSASSSPPSARG